MKTRLLLAAAALLPLASARLLAQNRGVYPLGMSATNSGVVPAPGLTYANVFIFYSRDESKGPDGETLGTGSNSVLLDLNTFAWVSEPLSQVGGAKYSLAATIPIANNSLSSDVAGSLSGGGGLGDAYFQPLILGWTTKRADLRFAYGFLAPTGRFQAGASDNVGSGYWTHALSAAETFSLTENRATAISAYEIYEWHTSQEGTGIHPGDTFSLDYSATHTVSLRSDIRLQFGVAGYEQWQTTARSGANLTPAEEASRYRINAIGVAANVVLAGRKMSLGAKYLKEFSNKSSFQGYSVQVSGSVNF
ncbi:MAG TPA: transporter [Thermoanaerobaculia bacterium]|nr:transporter [Thermoanaerobaculia bacterium]